MRLGKGLILITILMSIAHAADDDARLKARAIFGRVAGAVPSASVLDQMAALIRSGNTEAAVQVALDSDHFINTTIPALVRPWFSRTDNVEALFDDGIVTAAYIVANDMSAKNFLTANFIAQLDPAKIPPSSVLPNGRIVRDDLYFNEALHGQNFSRNHWQQIQMMGVNIKNNMIRTPQHFSARHNDANGVDTYYFNNLPDEQTMGLVTTRQFMRDWHFAGTGRAGVQQVLKKFLCIDLADVKAFNIPDDRVGHDVTRTPGGSNTQYNNSCKGCHSQMDALRSVWKNLVFRDGDDSKAYVAYTKDPEYIASVQVRSNPLGHCAGTGDQNELSAGDFVPRKYWRNCDANNPPVGELIQGSTVPQIRFIQDVFGWRPTANIPSVPRQGAWVDTPTPSALGEYMAGSKAFSACMVKTVFKQVCRRPAGTADAELIEEVRQAFETTGNYRMPFIYKKLGAHSSCIGGL